jgi:hypothetical protein
MKKTIIVILVILVSVFFIYQNFKNKEEIKTINENQQEVANSRLVLADMFQEKVLNIEDEYVKFDVKYPYFNNASDEFNSKIENLLKKSIEESKISSKENWQARFNTQAKGDNIPEVPVMGGKFSYFSDYKIVQSNTDYISVLLIYGGFDGGAHGYENIFSYNYDVKNKKTIELKDLFNNDTSYLNKLSTSSRELLKKKYAVVTEEEKKNSSPEALKEYVDNSMAMIESGTEPKLENFSVFTFTPDKVKIHFGQYQVGPYVIGMPEVEIDR